MLARKQILVLLFIPPLGSTVKEEAMGGIQKALTTTRQCNESDSHSLRGERVNLTKSLPKVPLDSPQRLAT
jgi:hypothetical protein